MDVILKGFERGRIVGKVVHVENLSLPDSRWSEHRNGFVAGPAINQEIRI